MYRFLLVLTEKIIIIDLVFDIEVTIADGSVPSATPSDQTRAPGVTVATVTAPAPTPLSGKPAAVPTGASFVVERAALTATAGEPLDAALAESALAFTELYSGTERAFEDTSVAEDQWYVYRVTASDESVPPAYQVVRGLTTAEFEASLGIEPPTAGLPTPESDDGSSLLWLWILLGVLAFIGVVVIAVLGVAKYFQIKEAEAVRLAYQSETPKVDSPPYGGGSVDNTGGAGMVSRGVAGANDLHRGQTMQTMHTMHTVKTVTSIGEISGPIMTYNAGAPSKPGGLGGNNRCEICGNAYPNAGKHI